MPIQNTGSDIRLRGDAADSVTDINEEINGNATDADVSLGTLNTSAFTNVSDGSVVTGRAMSEMQGYSTFTSALPQTEADGALGESLYFNASNEIVYLDRDTDFTNTNTTGTFSFWIKRNDIYNNNTTIYASGDNQTNRLWFRFNTSGSVIDSKLQIVATTNSNTEIQLVYDYEFIDASSWYHIVVAIDTTKSYQYDRVRTYANGVELTEIDGSVKTETWPSKNDNIKFNNNQRIGDVTWSTGIGSDMVVADFKFIEGTQLRPDSFGELVQGIWIPKAFNTPSTDTLVTNNLNVNLQFTDGANDEQSNYDGDPTNVSFLKNNYGIADFNGSSSKLELNAGALASGTGAKSITMWIATTTTAYSSLVKTGNGSPNQYWLFRVNSGTTLGISGYLGSGDFDVNVSHTNLFNGSWHQVAVTYDGTIQELFVDGQSVGTKTMSSLNIPSQNVFIGYQANNDGSSASSYFNGKIGEVQFYNDQLTPAEVKQNYSATKHKYTYGLNGFWLPLNNTSTGSIVDDTSLKLHLDASNNSSYSGSSTNWNDLTSNNNDGTISGASFLSSTNGGVFDFDGSNDKVDLANDVTTQDITMEAWFKPSTGNSDNDGTYIYNQTYAATHVSPYYSHFMGVESVSNRLDIRYGTNNGSSHVVFRSPTGSLELGKWQHWVITRKNNDVKFYKNGSLLATTAVFSSLSGATTFASGTKAAIGYRNSNNSNHFQGKIAQVRVYDEALTAQEVIQNYRATQGNYEQVSLVDISGNANSFTATNIDATDHVKDQPLENYATFDPNNKINGNATITLSEGNTKVSISSGSEMIKASVGVNTGKWYWEMTGTNLRNGTIGGRFGIITASRGGQTNVEDSDFHLFWHPQGTLYRIIDGSFVTPHIATGTQYYDNDVLAIALDCDAQEIKWYKNNTLAYTYDYSSHVDSSVYLTAEAHNSSSGTPVYNFNFGQKDFTYTPPTGFKALATHNLPAPAFDPDGATQDKPSNYFKAVTYQGNGGTQGEAYGYKEGSRAAFFNGTSTSYIQVGTSPLNGFAANSTYSVSFWFNANSFSAQFPTLVTGFTGTSTLPPYLWTDGTKIRFHGYQYGDYNATINTNQWYHIVMTNNGTTTTAYVNGSAVTLSGLTTWGPDAGDSFFIGGTGIATTAFDGKIDDVRIYSDVLTLTEVGYLADDDTTNIDAISNLVAHYDMEGNANNIDIVSTEFATWDSTLSSIPIYSEGNLRMTGGSGNKIGYSTESVSSGKWYWEHEVISIGGESSFGIARPGDLGSHYVVGTSSTSWGLYVNGNVYHNGSITTSGYMSGGFANGDIIGVELDLDNGTLEFYKNGTGYGNAFTGLSGEFLVAAEARTSGGSNDHRTNFGASAWDYTPSTGFQGLYLKYNGTDTNVTYTQDKPYGNINVGFAPDLVWWKNRDIAAWPQLHDSIRGAGNRIFSNDTSSTQYDAQSITSFDSNGFSIGTSSDFNGDCVAWAWKAGGAAVSNTDGTITSQVSANTEAGFSIVKYTGSNSAGATIGHGLSLEPDLIIVKGLQNVSAYNWMVYSSSATTNLGNSGEQGHAYLNLTNVYEEPSNQSIKSVWNDTAPTSTVFSVSDNVNVNANGAYIAYCFHSVDGFSKIGSYTGNGSTDGPFVYTGFKPAFVMVKRTDAAGFWTILDNKRDTRNPNDKPLYANASNTESTAQATNFYSNGFKPVTTDSDVNASGSYIFMAFAEDPVKYSNGVATLGDGNEFIEGGNYPEDNFVAQTWTGTATARSIEYGFKPDLWIVKNRTTSYGHYWIWQDTVRGPRKMLYSNATNNQGDWGGDYVEFADKGINITYSGTNTNGINENGFTYVGHGFKAAGNDNTYNILENGTVTSSASASTLGLDTGTITPDGISANKDNGFSIIKWTGNGISGSKINHGLSKPPEIILTKGLTNPTSWIFGIGGIPGLGDSDYMTLNTTSVLSNTSTFYQAYDANTFTVGVSSANEMNKNSSNEYISYAWHSVPGFSKIGTYSGTNAAGNAQNLGFEPAFVMVKRYVGAASNWVIFENKRPGGILRFDLTNVEASDTRITLTSTGFQFTGAAYNETNTKWIYMAFAHR